jgi:hypothetical protein
VLAFLDQHSKWAQLLLLEVPVSGTTTLTCTRRLHDALAPVLEAARDEVIVGAEVKPSSWLIAELIVLACLSLIRAQMLKARQRPLTELAPSLQTQVIEPYLGRAAQQAEHAGDLPGDRGKLPPRAEVVPIRPHPRTVLALQVIASAPGLSTRQIGGAVGIDNSGHRSGLMHRLAQRGLIENASMREARSARHAWFLTPYGQRILEILDASSSTAHQLEESGQLKARA